LEYVGLIEVQRLQCISAYKGEDNVAAYATAWLAPHRLHGG
jgi:hypothetical protein